MIRLRKCTESYSMMLEDTFSEMMRIIYGPSCLRNTVLKLYGVWLYGDNINGCVPLNYILIKDTPVSIIVSRVFGVILNVLM